MFKVQVIADSSGEWVGNGLKFDTVEKAREYAVDLSCRWILVTAWRVIDEAGTVIADVDHGK